MLATDSISENHRDTDNIEDIDSYGNTFAFGPKVAGFCLASFNYYILTAVFHNYKMSD